VLDNARYCGAHDQRRPRSQRLDRGKAEPLDERYVGYDTCAPVQSAQNIVLHPARKHDALAHAKAWPPARGTDHDERPRLREIRSQLTVGRDQPLEVLAGLEGADT
jgi:hypothetical protein